MAQLKTALPLSAIEKMAVEYLTNPETLVGRDSLNRPRLAYSIYRKVFRDKLIGQQHDYDVAEWIKFCIDQLIKQNVLVQEEDTFRTLRLSDDYLSRETANFTLDEGSSRADKSFSWDDSGNVQFNDERIKSEIIDTTSNYNDGSTVSIFDIGNDIITPSFYARTPPSNEQRAKILNHIWDLIHDMIDDGTLLQDRMGIKISPDHLERETRDFNLNENDNISLTSDEKIKELILDDVLQALQSGTYIDKYLIFASIWRNPDIKTASDTMIYIFRNRVDGLINELIEDNILTYADSSRDHIILSDEYLSQQTQGFNLDEGSSRDVNHSSPSTAECEMAIIDAILTLDVTARGNILSHVASNFFKKYSNVNDAREIYNFISHVMSNMMIEGIVDEIYDETGNEMFITDEYLERETESFNLDEALERYDTTHEEIVAEIIEMVATSHEARTIINLIRSVRLNHGPRSERGDRSCPAVYALKDIIKNLIDTNVLVYSEKAEKFVESKVKISPDYLAKETEDFSLDESIMFVDRIITDDQCRDAIMQATLKFSAPFRSEVVQLAFNILTVSEGYDIHFDEGEDLYDFVWQTLQEMIDDGTITYDDDEGCKISPEYARKATQDFTLDESVDNSKKKQYYVVSDDGKITFDEDVLESEIMNSLTTTHEGWDDEGGIEFENLIYWTALDIVGGEDVIRGFLTADELADFTKIWDALHSKLESTINTLAKRGALLKIPSEWPENDREYIKISPDYLEKETHDFSLDEGSGKSAASREFFYFDDAGRISFDESIARARIIEAVSILSSNDIELWDPVTMSEILSQVIEDYQTEMPHWKSSILYKVEDYIESLILKMIDEGVLVSVPDINYDNKIDVIKLSPGYLERETTGFSLDESINLTTQDSVIKEVILNEVIKLIKDGDQAYVHIIFGAVYDKMLTHEWSDFFRVREKVYELIGELVDDNILTYVGGLDDELLAVTLSDEYLARETTGFNLDEAVNIANEKQLYTIDNDGKIYFDDAGIKEAIVIAILEGISKASNRQEYILVNVVEGKHFNPWHITNVRARNKFRNKVRQRIGNIISTMIDRKELLEKHDSYWGKVLIVSDEYIAKEIESFNLDESLRSIMRSILSEGIDEIRDEIIQGIRSTLLQELPYPMHLLDLKLVVCEDIFGDENLSHKEFDAAIENLVSAGIIDLTEDTEAHPDRDFETRPGAWINASLTDDYFRQQTQDFSLDESLRTQIIQDISSIT